jgi:hypothetical protein
MMPVVPLGVEAPVDIPIPPATPIYPPEPVLPAEEQITVPPAEKAAPVLAIEEKLTPVDEENSREWSWPTINRRPAHATQVNQRPLQAEVTSVPATEMEEASTPAVPPPTPPEESNTDSEVEPALSPPNEKVNSTTIDDSVSPDTPQTAGSYLYKPSSAALTAQLLPVVQQACGLAQRGALYAAQAEFIQVVRRVAQANDAELGIDDHSRALAEGLRALDEARDFVPSGTGLEGELSVSTVASSHRTPVIGQGNADVAPHDAVALYHSFAEERLAAAVGGQQAGSMALFGLGKVHTRLAAANKDDILSTHNAMTMYLAALAACPTNYLAANELGVLLCRSGHPAEAAQLFERTIDYAPSATAYHNLAVAQERLGLSGHASANQAQADRLAAWERATGAVSRRAGVQWVTPEQMTQVASAPVPAVPVSNYDLPRGLPTAQNAPQPVPYTAAPVLPKSPWQRAAALAKSLSLPGTDSSDKTQTAPPGPRTVSPETASHPPASARR